MEEIVITGIKGVFTLVKSLPDYDLGWFKIADIDLQSPILIKKGIKNAYHTISVRMPEDWQMWKSYDLLDPDDLTILAAAKWNNPESKKPFDASTALKSLIAD